MIRKLRVITPTKLKTLCPVFGPMPQSFWTSEVFGPQTQDSLIGGEAKTALLYLISSNSQPLHQMDLKVTFI